MLAAYLILLAIALCFGLVLAVGAPYVPTLTPQVKVALDMAGLKKGQTMLELGSGDGKVLIAAAQRGLNVVGYELNPILVIVSRLRTRRYRKQVTIVWGSFWSREWPQSDAIFTFLHPRFMQKLDTKIVQYNSKPVKLVSFAFEITGRIPVEKKQGVFLYRYE